MRGGAEFTSPFASTNSRIEYFTPHCRRSVRACLLLSVQVGGPYRLLRILVDTRKTAGIELMGSIGHEPQHAIEVLSNPKITDSRTLYQFYGRVAPTDNDSFETQEA